MVEAVRLRDGLTFTLQRYGTEACYHIEDPVTSRFYRIGRREHAFIIRLDAQVSPARALAAANQEIGRGDALSEAEAGQILIWLEREQLLAEALGPDAPIPATRPKHGAWLRRMNMIFIRVPLLNPDRLLDRMLPLFRWMLGWPFFLVWLAVCSTGAYQVYANWDRFTGDAAGVFYVGNWLWLLVVWIVLKVTHELFHGLVSKKYGGQVYEAGVILVLLLPVGYVDATSSWRFPSKWRRIHVAAAGMYIELFAAGSAAWIWVDATSGVVANVAFNTIVIASISTLLFNGNPLMRFDGYFVLSDLLDIPNLYARGQAFVQRWARRCFLGTRRAGISISPLKDVIVAVYGVAAFAWRCIVLVILVVAAYSLFYGAGVIIAALAVLTILVPPLMRITQTLIRGSENEPPRLGAFVVRTGLIAAGVAVLVTQVDWSRDVVAPSVVDYADFAVVRTRSPGFVGDIAVAVGAWVDEDAVLLELVNPELDAQLEALRIAVAESELQARIHFSNDAVARYQAELANVRSLRDKLSETQRQVEELVVRAPRSGRVVAPRLAELLGVYLHTGQALLGIGDEEQKELWIAIGQSDIGDPGRLVGEQVSVRVTGRPYRPFAGSIERVSPRASHRVERPELAAVNGGPIAVRPADIAPDRSARDQDRYEYLEPHFDAVVRLSPEVAAALRPGEVGAAHFPGQGRALGVHVYNAVETWIRHLAGRRSLPATI